MLRPVWGCEQRGVVGLTCDTGGVFGERKETSENEMILEDQKAIINKLSKLNKLSLTHTNNICCVLFQNNLMNYITTVPYDAQLWAFLYLW